MADINSVTLVGRLTRDAELKYTNGGTAYSKFSIAVNKRKKQGEEYVDEAHFFNITLWGKIAEALNGFLLKGKQVGIDGELTFSKWESNGQNRTSVEVTANNIMLLGSKT